MSIITFSGFSQKTCVLEAYFEATPLQVCTGDSVLFENRTGGDIDDTTKETPMPKMRKAVWCG